MRHSLEKTRVELAERLGERRTEIEQAVQNRIAAIADRKEASGPNYVDGLQTAIVAALRYGLQGIERGEERAPSIPAALLLQARVAARSGISLDTVLRRYFAGYTLLGDFLVEEAREGDLLHGDKLKLVLRGQAVLFDRLLAEVSEEYRREVGSHAGSSERRIAERIERLLSGELLDTANLAYDFDGNHIGAVARGQGAEEAIRDIAAQLGRELLLVPFGDACWAWLGGRRPVEPQELDLIFAREWPAQVRLAFGEPARGLEGWRLTHRQAAAGLPVAERTERAIVRYVDVALLGSLLMDDLLATSMRELFLVPLNRERGGGEVARSTLRAYFSAARNISSTAAMLRVSRNTVSNRLHVIEERLERPLASCAAELETALRLEELERSGRDGALSERQARHDATAHIDQAPPGRDWGHSADPGIPPASSICALRGA